MVTKWSNTRALDLSIPTFCTKYRHECHGASGFANYENQNDFSRTINNLLTSVAYPISPESKTGKSAKLPFLTLILLTLVVAISCS